jgi:hypothetical protein
MRTLNHIRFAAVAGFVLSLGLGAFAADLQVRAYVDRNAVGLNETFTLSVELSGGGVNGASAPQLPKMDDFAAFLGSGSSQSVQIVNGRMSISKTISYQFQARAAGSFTIGPISVTSGGTTQQTQPIPIKIEQGAAARPSSPAAPAQSSEIAESDLFMRAYADKRRVYVNEPVVVSYKLYTRLPVSSFSYSKIPTTTGFWADDFPMPSQPQAVEEILQNKKYTTAVLKKTALFPLTAGVKTIEPMSVDCEVRAARRTRDPFDDFFDDSFFFGRTEKKTAASVPLSVTVMPLPEAGKPADFSGAVGKFAISASLDKNTAKTNEAVTLRIKIEGRGNIHGITDPKPDFPSDFEVYPPKIAEQTNHDGGTVSGSKTYEFVFVPRSAGSKAIQPVAFSYFDPEAEAYKTVRTPGFTIAVKKGGDAYSAIPSGLSKEEVKLLGKDLRYIQTHAVFDQNRQASDLFKFILWMAPLVGLTAAILRRRRQDLLEGDVAYARSHRAGRDVRKRLDRARALLDPAKHQEFYGEVGRALHKFLGDKLNIAEAGMIADEVKALLRQRGTDEDAVSGYFECLSVCDLKRFSPSGSSKEEMKTFLATAEAVITRLGKALK